MSAPPRARPRSCRSGRPSAPGTTRSSSIDAADEVVFVGVRGQLDPFRGLRGGAHAGALARLGALLVRRRLRRSPVIWHARTTSRVRRRTAPGELATLALLRILARRRAAPRAPGEAAA
jgi:hypothetical protein